MSEFVPSKVSIKDLPLHVKSTNDKMTFLSMVIIDNVLAECSPSLVHVNIKSKRTNSKSSLSHSSKELLSRPW